MGAFMGTWSCGYVCGVNVNLRHLPGPATCTMAKRASGPPARCTRGKGSEGLRYPGHFLDTVVSQYGE